MQIKLKNIDKKIKYYDLIMVRDLKNIKECDLPNGLSYSFWNNDNCKQDWINIHIATGEFNSVDKEAEPIFNDFYNEFYSQLCSRCVFIENDKGEKIATATISPANEYGYKCVIDWFAISPKAQGLKLSKLLLSKVLLIAKNLGYKKVLLHTQTTTWLAVKIYLDYGFKPFKTEGNKGWNILQTIINHPELTGFKKINENEIYDDLMIKIEQELDKIHKNYNYSVWYINNRNDVYVKEENNYYEYKFKLENENVSLFSVNKKIY